MPAISFMIHEQYVTEPEQKKKNRIFRCIAFHARPSEPRHSVGETDYGARFTSALGRDNIFATQFHPEKSADHGLALYRNFLHWTP